MSDRRSAASVVAAVVVGTVVVGGTVFVIKRLFDRSSEDKSLATLVREKESEIRQLKAELAMLGARTEEELIAREAPLARPSPSGRPVRVYMDGCFDLMHYGHANAVRQAKALGDVLVVGIHSDEEIARNKGPPVMKYDERISMLQSMKWVDEIICDAPYSPTDEWLSTLFNRYNIDFLVHGDDPTFTPDGHDAYDAPKRAGRMKIIKRTEGVSTTDIVGRMLLMTRTHHIVRTSEDELGRLRSMSDDFAAASGRRTGLSRFLPTTRRIIQFSKGLAPNPSDRIVLISGAFDLFHVGHAEALRKAREFGDFLLVGIHDDEVVNQRWGSHYPIMNLHERALSVLACKYVDEVIIGCPREITRDMIVSMNINVVVTGTECETKHFDPRYTFAEEYRVPQEMGVLQVFPSSRNTTAQEVVARVMRNRAMFEEKYSRKSKSESTYLQQKQFVQEQ